MMWRSRRCKSLSQASSWSKKLVESSQEMVTSQGTSWSHHTQVKGVIPPGYLALVFHKPRLAPSAVPLIKGVHSTFLPGWLVTPLKGVFNPDHCSFHKTKDLHVREFFSSYSKLSVLKKSCALWLQAPQSRIILRPIAARFFLPVHTLTKLRSGQLLHWATSSVQCAHMGHICFTMFLYIELNLCILYLWLWEPFILFYYSLHVQSD